MLGFFYAIPPAAFLFVALALAISFAAAGQTYVHRLFNPQDFIAHNEVGGILIAVSGTLYAVVLGFLTVIVWQHFVEARQIVVTEANGDIDAWHSAVGLPAMVRTHVRNDMVQYANVMVRNEWPSMRAGAFDSAPAIIIMDAIDAAAGFVPANSKESNAQVSTLQELMIVHDARQERIEVNGNGVSWFEWLVLLIGAFAVVGFCWLFGLRNARVQLVMTAAVVTITVATLVLLFELQFPFRSAIGIGPDAWNRAIVHIKEMQAGEMPDMRS